MSILLQPLLANHWPEVSRIYREGINTGIATFETSSPSWESWDRSHLPHSRWIAILNDQIVGWAALSPVSDRCVYGGVGEVSVYVDQNSKGKGIGRQLLEKVLTSSEKNGIWTVTAAMFPENIASIILHEKCGFRKIGYREKIGKLDGMWRDTVLFERRSSTII